MDNAAPLNVAALVAHKTYHSEDNITELCTRVRLRPCQTQGIVGRVPPADSQIMGPSTSGAALLGPSQTPPVVAEEMEEFTWAQRVLGYHEPPGPSEIRQGRRLFARYYPAGMQPFEDEGGLSPIVDIHDEQPTGSCACMHEAIRRFSTICKRLGCCHRNRKAVARSVAENLRVESLSFYDRMQLFAVLDVERDSDEGGTARIEVLLCDLRAQDAGKVLTVQPPFSKTVAGEVTASSDDIFTYQFELPDGKAYEYSIENVSHIPTESERRKAAEAQHGFETAAPQLRKNLAGSGFEGLGHALTQLAVVGEIISFEPKARGTATTVESKSRTSGIDVGAAWEAEALMRRTTPIPFHAILYRPSFYVVYELSLPGTGEWEVFGDSLGKGTSMCTQFTSLSGCTTQKERCIFNHPIELHLSHNPLSQATLDTSPPHPLPPRLVLQVLQVGSWDRHTLHGYTFVDIPKLPGEYDVHVPLWAPVGTITQQLHAKLCGAFIPLASLHLVAIADMHQRDALPRNRSSLRAQTAAGMLHLRLNVVRRRRPSLLLQPSIVPGAKLAIGDTAEVPGEQLEGLRRRRAARAQRKAEAAHVATTAGALLANVQHQPLRW